MEGRWPDTTGGQDYLKCYISAVDDAGHFWVQVLNARSGQLDKLIQDMTTFYNQECNQVCYIEIILTSFAPIRRQIDVRSTHMTSI